MTKYVIISPVRDEEEFIENTIESVLSQTIRPAQWILVNDGSTDRTGSIIDDATKEYPWIQAVHRENRGFRKSGGGVVEAFYDGYITLSTSQWDYIVKLDGDLSFESDYFEKIFSYFKDSPKLGIGGGAIYNMMNGTLVLEKTPLFHVRGATKIYRKECWNDIGGLMIAPGWDTLDEVKANMLGWETRNFKDLKIVHHRLTGSEDGAWRNSVKFGLANYISGYHPLFMFCKFLKRTFERPYLIGSMGLLYGFIKGYANKIPRVEDRDIIDYIRKQQLNRILFRETIWK